MLNKLRSFSRGKLATVLVGIIIIPFVFWGMGGVFSSGNTNTIVKITDDQLQIIYGSYLGDGNISYTSMNRCRLRIQHSIKQKDYCLWKTQLRQGNKK